MISEGPETKAPARSRARKEAEAVPRLVSLRGVADALGVTLDFLRDCALKDRPGFEDFPRIYKIAGRWMIEQAALLKWLDSRQGERQQHRMRSDWREQMATQGASRRRRAAGRLASGSRPTSDAGWYAP